MHPGNSLTGRVGGDVLDVSQVNAVNPAQLGERIQAAQVQHQHRLGLGILLVVGKGGLDQKLFTNIPGRRMAALADIAAPDADSVPAKGWEWDSREYTLERNAPMDGA